MMRKAIALALVAAVGLLLTYALYVGAPDYGSFPVRTLTEQPEQFPVGPGELPVMEDGQVQSIGQLVLEDSSRMPPSGTGALNAVTGVLWGYRAYDTLGEATVLFASVIGVVMVAQAGFSIFENRLSFDGMTIVARTAGRVVFPFSCLFGVYLMIYGHMTPGGGFPGGVVIAASILVLVLTFGIQFAKKIAGYIGCEIGEEIGAIVIMGVGIIGLFGGSFFFENILTGGDVSQLFGAGNMIVLNLAVGLKVATGLLLILYALLSPLGGEEH